MKKFLILFLIAVGFLGGAFLLTHRNQLSSSFTGKWQAFAYTIDDTSIDVSSAGSAVIDLNLFGQSTLTTQGYDPIDLTWDSTADNVTVKFLSSTMTGTMNGNVLVLTDAYRKFYLTKGGAAAQWQTEPSAPAQVNPYYAYSTGNINLTPDDWIGNYSGSVTIDEIFGTVDGASAGEADDVHGQIFNSIGKEEHMKMTADTGYLSSVAQPFWTPNLNPHSSYLAIEIGFFMTPKGQMSFSENELFEPSISDGVVVADDPLTIMIKGKYTVPDTTDKNGFYWTAVLQKTGTEYWQFIEVERPTSDIYNAEYSLQPFSTAAATVTGNGFTITYPEGKTASTDAAGNPIVTFDNGEQITVRKEYSPLLSMDDKTAYEKKVVQKMNYRITAGYLFHTLSDYYSDRCCHLEHGEDAGGKYHQGIEYQIYPDNENVITITLTTQTAEQLQQNNDLLLTLTSIDW